MAHLGKIITGPAAGWLESNREELNRRFKRAHRRNPGLDADRVLLLLGEILPPLAGEEPESADLLSSVYDLILLHARRDTFSTCPALGNLLRETFPRIRAVLLQRPNSLPGALSNAVENTAERGKDLVQVFDRMAGSVEKADTLLDMGVVVAWRLGNPRIREAALGITDRLPPRAILEALDLGDWPDDAAALAVASLRGNSWQTPRTRISEKTLKEAGKGDPAGVAGVIQKLQGEPDIPPGKWRTVVRVGAFEGFGGRFRVPPLLLTGGSRHTLLARCDHQDHQIDADVFGWKSFPAPESPLSPQKVSSRGKGEPLLADGTLTIGDRKAKVAGLAGATSYFFGPGMMATSHADSHAIRITIGVEDPL